MIKTHFKRQGSAGLMILQGLPKNYHVEYDYKHGYLKIVGLWEIAKKWNGKIFYETHSKTLLYKNYTSTNNAIEFLKDIETEINIYCNGIINSQFTFIIENYIESYHIAEKEHPEDRHILNNIDITNHTTMQVIVKCNIKLGEYFKPWKVEVIENILNKPSENILNMKFSELYSLIHWNHYKKDFKEIFDNAV